ncbi:hypothetical protein ASE73_15440 [Sphingomonas sp. Leaf24]|nr:hypothetical protein ASE50_13665 [Sphingomonas sp. Leaf5]KQM93559.1 hypothetical protein ASE73_15440 [Sphingomonas sp. Leaf24]
MAIEKERLFERARKRWPLAVHVTPTNGSPPFAAKPCLVEVYQAIEAACEPTGERTDEDEWTGLANWSFHQALWAVAERSVSERLVYRDEVSFEMFDARMRTNLLDDCWIAERQQYEDSPVRFH